MCHFRIEIGLKAFINVPHRDIDYSNEISISLDDLKASPEFLRFNEVYIPYSRDFQPISSDSRDMSIQEKCHFFAGLLPSIKGALNDSKEICFYGDINENDPSNFSNHSTLIDYIRDEFLPICDLSRRYKFKIDFSSDMDAATNVVSSILKMPQIVQCLDVEIWICTIDHPNKLPVDEIVQWLNQKIDRIGFFGRKNEEKFLKILSWKIQDVLGICEHLTEVLFIS